MSCLKTFDGRSFDIQFGVLDNPEVIRVELNTGEKFKFGEHGFTGTGIDGHHDNIKGFCEAIAAKYKSVAIAADVFKAFASAGPFMSEMAIPSGRGRKGFGATKAKNEAINKERERVLNEKRNDVPQCLWSRGESILFQRENGLPYVVAGKGDKKSVTVTGDCGWGRKIVIGKYAEGYKVEMPKWDHDEVIVRRYPQRISANVTITNTIERVEAIKEPSSSSTHKFYVRNLKELLVEYEYPEKVIDRILNLLKAAPKCERHLPVRMPGSKPRGRKTKIVGNDGEVREVLRGGPELLKSDNVRTTPLVQFG